MAFIWFIIIGACAGWIAGKIMKGGGFGFFGNIIVGIIGGVLGGFVFGLFGITAFGIIGSLLTAVIGAVILLWIVGMITKN